MGFLTQVMEAYHRSRSPRPPDALSREVMERAEKEISLLWIQELTALDQAMPELTRAADKAGPGTSEWDEWLRARRLRDRLMNDMRVSLQSQKEALRARIYQEKGLA